MAEAQTKTLGGCGSRTSASQSKRVASTRLARMRALAACGPSLGDVLAGEMNHGVERTGRFEADLPGQRIPGWTRFVDASSPAQRHDAVAFFREPRNHGPANEPARAGDQDFMLTCRRAPDALIQATSSLNGTVLLCRKSGSPRKPPSPDRAAARPTTCAREMSARNP